MGKVILHIDMNAFFATVEKILDPSLKDKPIVIGHDSSRSVVSTACYLARKYGIKSIQLDMYQFMPDAIDAEREFYNSAEKVGLTWKQ